MARALRHDLVDAAVLEVYGMVREQGWLADRALDRVLRRERRLYAGERRGVAEAVYGILRAQGQLEWLAGPGFDPDPAALYALWLARSGAAAPDAAARRLGVPPALVARAVDRADARIEAIADPVARLAARGSLPPWLAERFLAEHGVDGAAALADALGQRAPLTVRSNVLRTSRDALRSRLAEAQVQSRPTRFSPWGLVLDGHANAFALTTFQEGLFEIQDEGSQLVALAVGARPGQHVVDACAGAGGKTLALAGEMGGKGTLFGLDPDADRLAEARRRARRAGVHNLRTRAIPAGPEAGAALGDLEGRCDRVLVDAPCSGTGTLRRKPDARWRLRPEDLPRFAALQRELVARFARLLRPGGRLVYATCALDRDENGAVADFIERELELAPASLAGALGGDLAAALGASGHSLQLLPNVHGTDGFFLAAFARPAA